MTSFSAPDSPIIELRDISLAFGATVALDRVSLSIFTGEVHAICGENGAGKSTFNRIISGNLRQDSGQILLRNQPIEFRSAIQAEVSGIAMVHQESVAFLDLTCSENHEIMREPSRFKGLWLDRLQMAKNTRESLSEIGEVFPENSRMSECSVAQRQMTAIARALSSKCKLLILDEPTASLSARESQNLFNVIRKLRKQGVAIVYVSHRLDEVFSIADRITILRDGQLVSNKITAETNPNEVIKAMVGREIVTEQRKSKTIGEVRLKVQNLTRQNSFRDINFEVREGEIVGLSGLIGAGRSEVARAIFGLDPVDSGSVLVDGEKFQKSASEVVRQGVAFVPEDRQHQGLHLTLSIRENLMMANFGRSPLIQPVEEATKSAQLIDILLIKTASDDLSVSALSGGNQQKVLLGKWLEKSPKILILDEPTRGVDIGAKSQIHDLIRDLASRGIAVLLISSEQAELLSICDRFLVMNCGELVANLSHEEATQENLLALSLPKESTLKSSKGSSFTIKRESSLAIILISVLVAVGMINHRFFEIGNMTDILVNIAPTMIVGTMMTFLVLAREIDISVGSLMGLCAGILGIASSPHRLGLSPTLAIIVCLVTGLIGGLINGTLVAYIGIPSIIVTLGTLALFRGIDQILLAGKWINSVPSIIREMGTGSFLGIPFILIVAAIVMLKGVWIERNNYFGIRIKALGSNPSAAKLIGIKPAPLKLLLFGLTGLSCAVAAIFSATQLRVIESSYGTGFELVVVAAVIVGGTSIRGGKGSLTGTYLAAILLGIVSTVLIFLRLGESATFWDRAIEGGFILIAVLSDYFIKGTRTNN